HGHCTLSVHDALPIYTLGGWLGYVFTPLFTCFLPSRERLNQVSYQRGSRVSYVRRGFAFLVDAGVEVVVAAPLWLILPLGQRSGDRESTRLNSSHVSR